MLFRLYLVLQAFLIMTRWPMLMTFCRPSANIFIPTQLLCCRLVPHSFEHPFIHVAVQWRPLTLVSAFFFAHRFSPDDCQLLSDIQTVRTFFRPLASPVSAADPLHPASLRRPISTFFQPKTGSQAQHDAIIDRSDVASDPLFTPFFCQEASLCALHRPSPGPPSPITSNHPRLPMICQLHPPVVWSQPARR